MALIVRYVKVDSSEEQIKESFLNFFPLHRKSADKITKSILDELQQNGLDIMLCRGQAYDNASTMAGIRSGVQCRINKLILKQYLFHVLIIRLTSQAFTQWHRLNILQHFLLLWKGSNLFFLLLLKDGKCYLSMYQLW